MTPDDIAKINDMNISPNGKLVGFCRLHLVDYMKRHTEPIRTPELINKLVAEHASIGFPKLERAGSVREAYMAALTTERQNRTIETSTDWYMWWHEHAPRGKEYRGHAPA